MTFCGNVMELVEKKEVLDGYLDFKKWPEIEENPDIEVYIEASLIPELKEKDKITIDAAIGEVKGEKIGMLFIQRDPNSTI